MSKIIRWGLPPEKLSDDGRCPFAHWDYYKRRRTLGPVGACRLHSWVNRQRYQRLKQGMSL